MPVFFNRAAKLVKSFETTKYNARKVLKKMKNMLEKHVVKHIKVLQ